MIAIFLVRRLTRLKSELIEQLVTSVETGVTSDKYFVTYSKSTWKISLIQSFCSAYLKQNECRLNILLSFFYLKASTFFSKMA